MWRGSAQIGCQSTDLRVVRLIMGFSRIVWGFPSNTDAASGVPWCAYSRFD